MSSIIVNNTERNWRKTIKASLAFSVQFWTEIFQSWQVSLRPAVLRHVMYTIVDQYRDISMTMKERLGASLLTDTPWKLNYITFNFLGVPARLIFHVIKIGRFTRAGKATAMENGL